MLHSVSAGDGRKLVLVHGFTQTAAAWSPVAALLADRFRVVSVDAPGHGGSGAVRVEMEEAAALLGATGGRAAYAGYSMGGRICLRLAVDRPDLVEALVLIGVSAGIADPGERTIRRAADERLADELEATGVEAFLDRWLAGPLFAHLSEAQAGRADRARNSAAGLASALRLLGTGRQEPLWERLGELDMPVLLVAGAKDRRFSHIASEMARAIGPNAEVALVEGAGHAVPLERPDETAALIAGFPHRVAPPPHR